MYDLTPAPLNLTAAEIDAIVDALTFEPDGFDGFDVDEFDVDGAN